MKKLFILPSFERSVKNLTTDQKQILVKSLESFNQYLLTGQSTYGFRLKKINHDKYEFRIDLRLRIIAKKDKDGYYLVIVGNHNEIRRYLRENR